MSRSLASPLTPAYLCHACGSDIGYRSRPRTFVEHRILPLLLLKAVRCGECFQRDYRLMFTPVRERPSSSPEGTPKKSPSTVTATAVTSASSKSDIA